jgi:hypothetical protein
MTRHDTEDNLQFCWRYIYKVESGRTKNLYDRVRGKPAACLEGITYQGHTKWNTMNTNAEKKRSVIISNGSIFGAAAYFPSSSFHNPLRDAPAVFNDSVSDLIFQIQAEFLVNLIFTQIFLYV